MPVATDAMTKQERVLTRKVEQLQRKLEQIDKVASENEKVSSNVYRELDALSRQLGVEKEKVSALLRILEKYVPKGARDEIAKPAVRSARRRTRPARDPVLGSARFHHDVGAARAGRVVRLLDTYLEAMTAVILARGGDINEYIGDAILAVFPTSAQAVEAARAMQDALEVLRRSTTDDEVRTLRMGIGVHVGEVVEGNIGTADRVKFGVVGDTVNLAARIQDRSREGTRPASS